MISESLNRSSATRKPHVLIKKHQLTSQFLITAAESAGSAWKIYSATLIHEGNWFSIAPGNETQRWFFEDFHRPSIRSPICGFFFAREQLKPHKFNSPVSTCCCQHVAGYDWEHLNWFTTPSIAAFVSEDYWRLLFLIWENESDFTWGCFWIFFEFSELMGFRMSAKVHLMR